MYSELQVGPERIFIKYGILLSAGIPDQDFRVFALGGCVVTPHYHLEFLVIGTIIVTE
jgi:hypothetical protein